MSGNPVESQKVLRSKSKVKFYFRTVRSRVIPILKRVEVGDYPSKIARIYGWSKQHVFYYIRKLEKAGLVRRKVRSNVVFYELTRKGQKCMHAAQLDIDHRHVSSRIHRMNNRMEQEIGENIIEKHGHKWKLIPRFRRDFAVARG